MTSTLAAPTSAPAPSHLAAPVSAWDEPEGVAARGTLVALTGRGETAAAYGRFGRRISADAYRVRVVTVDLDDLGAAHEEVHALLADDSLPAPRVLVGADTGATFASVLAQGGQHALDGLVLAGIALPGASTSETSTQSWDAELETRTACPAHRRVITEDRGFDRGALGRELPQAWDDFAPAPSGLPTLVVHGRGDPLTPVADALAPFRDHPATQTWVVEGGRHDVLNDVTHRSVAATVVLFLERLKLGSDLPGIVVRDDSRG